MKTKNVTAIILVAGSSTRFGQNRNKNFDKVGGKEILLYSLEAFNQNELVDDIIIVYKKGEEKTLSTIIGKVSTNCARIIKGKYNVCDLAGNCSGEKIETYYW